MTGRKFDKGKARWDLLPWNEVGQIVQVLTYGAQKYDDDNWKHVRPFFRRYFSAMMRHIFDRFIKNERLDPGSGLPHLAHAGCCLLFLMWGDKRPGEVWSERS